MQRTPVVLAAAAVLAMAALVVNDLLDSPVSAAPGDEARPPTRPAPGRVAALAAAVVQRVKPAAATPPAGGTVSLRLQRELQAAQDWRAFALAAVQRPAEGGLFYARYVASECGVNVPAILQLARDGVAKEVKDTGTVNADRLQHIDDFERRCSAFVHGEIPELLERIQREAAAGTDPLLAAQFLVRQAAKSRSATDLRAAVQRLLELDDPLLWTWQATSQYVMQGDDEARRSAGLYLDGKVVRLDVAGLEPMEAQLAYELGVCRPDSFCELDLRRSMFCVTGRVCPPDRAAYAEWRYRVEAGGTREGWQRVADQAVRVRQAAGSRNATMFVR